MKHERSDEIIDLDGCIVRDENGTMLAKVDYDGRGYRVLKATACSVGTYFYILSYLRDLGFEVR